MRGRVALVLSTALLILLPAGGTAVGGYLAWDWSQPEEPVPWLHVFVRLALVGLGALAGLAAGAGVGWVLALGLFRWANRCRLDEVPPEPPTR